MGSLNNQKIKAWVGGVSKTKGRREAIHLAREQVAIREGAFKGQGTPPLLLPSLEALGFESSLTPLLGTPSSLHPH